MKISAVILTKLTYFAFFLDLKLLRTINSANYLNLSKK